MLKDRITIRSEMDNHVIFKLFKVYYPNSVAVDYPIYEHSHTEFEISIIQSGSGVYNCAGIDYEFHTGDIFFHCGNDNHCFTRIDRKERLCLLVMQFEPRFIWRSGGNWLDSKYLKIFVREGKKSICQHIPYQESVAETIGVLLNKSFKECCDQDAAYEMFVKANLQMILANLARYYHDDIEPDIHLTKIKNVEQLEYSINYILSHLEETLTLDELAREAGMSRSYYSTMFKTMNGVSVWTYITNHRISKAQYLLEESELQIIEISEKCGFMNISNFNRAFKKNTGKTPREYRKECQKTI